MKIISMELENFRQYYGKQTIDFATGNENITIIFGENGKGKTGIFRALMFALYNATHIQQDNPEEPIHLVNLRLLDEQQGAVCTAKVTVRFEFKGRKYEIMRSVGSMKRGDRIQERLGDVKFYEMDENGNYSPTPIEEPQEVRKRINQILDEEIKDFFLFDGEKIDTLAKTNESVKREVKTAIFKLLQIDNVEDASRLLTQLKTNEQRRVIRDTVDTNAQGKQDEIDQTEKEIEKSEEYLEKLRVEQLASEELIKKYELQLSQNQEIALLQDKLNQYKTTKSSIEQFLAHLNKQIAEQLLKKMPYVLLSDSFNNVSNYLEGMISDEDSVVSLEAIENSLESKICACCNNDLTIHEENLEFVKLLKQNYKHSTYNEASRAILRTINDKQQINDEVKEEAIDLLRQYSVKEREIKQVEEDILDIERELGIKASEQLNLEETNNALIEEQQHAQNINEDIAKTNVYLDNLKEEKVKLENELDDIMRTNKNNLFEQKVIDIINSLTEDINNIAIDFSTIMRQNLTKATTDIFKRLIDKKDVDLIKQININDKFELEIISHDDIEITQDISQGQRQIVALAFITSLALVAAGEKEKIAFPLFMDSPFNRLSGINRDQLINHIPSLTSQWILLLTDTELTISEERVIKDNGKLGKWYRLNQKDTFYTVIEEVPLHETLTTRGM